MRQKWLKCVIFIVHRLVNYVQGQWKWGNLSIFLYRNIVAISKTAWPLICCYTKSGLMTWVNCTTTDSHSYIMFVRLHFRFYFWLYSSAIRPSSVDCVDVFDSHVRRLWHIKTTVSQYKTTHRGGLRRLAIACLCRKRSSSCPSDALLKVIYLYHVCTYSVRNYASFI